MSLRIKGPRQINTAELEIFFPGIDLQKIQAINRQLSFQIGIEHSVFTLNGLKKNISSEDLFENRDRFFGNQRLAEFSKVRKGFAAALVSTNSFEWIKSTQDLHDIRSFIGLKGQSSSFHFDWNLCDNILLNLDGEKTYRFFPPNRSQELDCVGNFTISKIKPTHEIKLSAGEALFLPKLWWHQAYYHTDASACSIRFRPNRKLLNVMKCFYPSWKVIEALSKSLELQDFELPRLRNVSDYIKKVETYLNDCVEFSSQDSKLYTEWCRKYVSHKAKIREFELALNAIPKSRRELR